MVYIVIGVSGIGKTTIGKLLSKSLKMPFYDADDFHSKTNIQKMANGIALNDADRAPWLNELRNNIIKWSNGSGAVLACSALKESYRTLLSTIDDSKIKWIFLHADIEIISERLKSRKNHYFNVELLQSQYETLEIPNYGLHINAVESTEQIVNKILQESMKMKTEFGLLGLGVMGKSLAINLANNGIPLAVFNRSIPNKEVDIAKNFAANNSKLSIQGFDDLQTFVSAISKPRNILLMVNAGKSVDDVITNILPYLEKDDLLIDGGNSHFKDTKKRIERLNEHQIHFIGMGVSGGEEGALKGPSMMPSGSMIAYNRISHMLEMISAKDKNGKACCAFIGEEGSGHFIKMIHNGIEYGEMQILGEIYNLLRFYGNKNPLEIASIFENWKDTDLDSYLLEITIAILRKKDGNDFLIDKILDQASNKGTGGWSVIAALELGKPISTISESVMARYVSAMKSTRVTASKIYDPSFKKNIYIDLDYLKSSYNASRIINHAIGFDTIYEASIQYKWDLNLSEIARIWTNGCIIRSTLMENIEGYLKKSNQHLLLHPTIVEFLNKNMANYADLVGKVLGAGCTIPVISSALNYFLSFISEQSSANIIQAQRDYFGAHTYKRNDRPFEESYHTNWNN